MENGYTVINQADCYKYIFKDLVEEEVKVNDKTKIFILLKNVELEFMIIVLIQFIREALGSIP